MRCRRLLTLVCCFLFLFSSFERDDIPRLARALDMPATVELENRMRIPGVEALCVLLWRLSYPNRWLSATSTFFRPESVLSRIQSWVVSFLWDTYQVKVQVRHSVFLLPPRMTHALLSLALTWCVLQSWDADRLTPEVLRTFADAVHRKGAALRTCFGFIDGTVRAVARPVRNQRISYNGHKRKHAFKCQSVSTPDGLIVHLHGPHEGKVHDATLLQRSGLLAILDTHAHDPDGQDLHIYGDPAYGLTAHLISPYKGAHIDDMQQAFNASMSAVRVSVEWAFGKVTQQFAFLDFAKNQKLLLQPVGAFYTVGVLLTNCHTCLYGSQTSEFFEVDPPALETYLQSLRLP